MTSKKEIADCIIEMFEDASVVKSTRERLIALLERVRDEALHQIGGDVAETLLSKLDQYDDVECSERQAYAMAFSVVEYGLESYL